MSVNEVHHRVRFGPYEADLQTLELWKHGIRIKLSGQPFQILKVLLNQPGKLITRDELRAQLWPDDTFVDFNHGLNAAVNKLRDALTDSADDPKYIETLPRRGYRFIGQVETAEVVTPVARAAVPQAVVIPEPERRREAPAEIAPDSPFAEIEIAPSASRRRWWLNPLIIALCTFAILIVGATIVHVIHRLNESVLMQAPKAEMLVSGQDSVVDPAFSPDGNRIAFIRRGKAPGTTGLFIKDVGGDHVVQLTRTPGDCCPSWSPDGALIAFARRGGDRQLELYLVPTTPGATEHQLDLNDVILRSGEVSWSADGKSVAFSGLSRTGTTSVYLFSLETNEIRQLTGATGSAEDWGPAFSPDGQRLAFVRRPGEGPEELIVSAANGQNARRILTDTGRIVGPPAWTSNGQSIVFASAAEGNPSLKKAPAGGGSTATIAAAGDYAWHPTTSRRGYRLAFQQILLGSSIIGLNLANPNLQDSQVVVTSSEGRNEGPQISPDGKRMVFMSDRSGTMEIWISNADGTNPVQLTALGSTGTPRWSPDGKLVVFDSTASGRAAIYVVPADGGEARVLVQDDNSNMVPSFSRDGKWVYYGSDRGSEWQVWKVPVSGGAAVQLTKNGGFAAMEGDGYVYYTKTRYPAPDIWRVPVAGGGMEQRLLPRVVPRTWASWALTDHGIVYMEDSLQSGFPLNFYDFSTQETRNAGWASNAAFWLAASRDGKTTWIDQANQEQSSIMMLENFR